MLFRSLELGIEPRTAFRSAFGLSVDVAELRVERALEDRRLRTIEVPLDVLDADALIGASGGRSAKVRAARPSEVAAVADAVYQASLDTYRAAALTPMATRLK